MRRIVWGSLVVVPLTAALVACSTPSAYAGSGGRTIVPLPTLGGDWNGVSAINNRGEVVGKTKDADGNFRAYLWSNGSIRDIGPHAGGIGEGASAINERGQVIVYVSLNPRQSRAYLYSDGRTTMLPTLGHTASWAADINDKGQIAGELSDYFRGPTRAVLWENGQARDLGPGHAVAINNRGQVLLVNDEGSWLWDRGRMTNLIANAPDLADRRLYPRAINNRGTVIGSAERLGQTGAAGFVARDGRLVEVLADPGHWGCQLMVALNDRDQTVGDINVGDDRCRSVRRQGSGPATILPTLGGSRSTVVDINARGDVAGAAFTAGDAQWRATVWEGGRITDLGLLPGDDSSAAVDINDHGAVVANSLAAGDAPVFHAFLSVPATGRW
jgi:probable HAF family extracellular repeat protein